MKVYQVISVIGFFNQFGQVHGTYLKLENAQKKLLEITQLHFNIMSNMKFCIIEHELND